MCLSNADCRDPVIEHPYLGEVWPSTSFIAAAGAVGGRITRRLRARGARVGADHCLGCWHKWEDMLGLAVEHGDEKKAAQEQRRRVTGA
jgi:hypothetical protein